MITVFEDAKDGKDGHVNLGLLDHDWSGPPCATEQRPRISYHRARHFEQAWDFRSYTAINVTPGASKPRPARRDGL